jgi:hypothetical protein
MALAEAKDARRRRSGGVVLSVQPELADAERRRLRVFLFVASGLRTSRVSVSQAQSE